jgi:hypothetical protein
MTPTFRRIAGWAAVKAALLSVVFTVTFGLYVRKGYHWAQWTSSIALMLTAVVGVPVLVALYARVREAEPELAVIALVTGLLGVIGSTVHGAYDVAVLAKPVGKGAADLPSQLDPRGFLTFAVTGLALGLFGWLVLRTGAFPKLVGQSGLASFVVLWVVYFGRLITVDPHKNVIRVAAVLSGLVLVPVFYLLIARSLLREEG